MLNVSTFMNNFGSINTVVLSGVLMTVTSMNS